MGRVVPVHPAQKNGPLAIGERTGFVGGAGMELPGLLSPGLSGGPGQEDGYLPRGAFLVFRVGSVSGGGELFHAGGRLLTNGSRGSEEMPG